MALAAALRRVSCSISTACSTADDRADPGRARRPSRRSAHGRSRLAFMTNNSARTPEAVAGGSATAGDRRRAGEVETSAAHDRALLSGPRLPVGLRGRGGGHPRRARRRRGRGPRRGTRRGRRGRRRAGTAAPTTRSCGRPRSLVERGAAFVGTNADASYPAAGRRPVARGRRACSPPIATTTGAAPEIVGKPNAPRSTGPPSSAPAAAPRSWSAIGSTRTSPAPPRWDGTACSCSPASRSGPTSRARPCARRYVADDLSILLSEA